MDAALWPRIILVAMLGAGVYLLARRVTVAGEAGSAEPSVTLVVIGATVAYGLLMPQIGYLSMTAIFLLAMTRYLGSRSIVLDVAVAVLGALALHLVFGELLGVRLPAGPLELFLGLG